MEFLMLFIAWVEAVEVSRGVVLQGGVIQPMLLFRVTGSVGIGIDLLFRHHGKASG